MVFQNRTVVLPLDVCIVASIGLTNTITSTVFKPTQEEIDNFFYNYTYDNSLLIPSNPSLYTELELYEYRIKEMIRQVKPEHLFASDLFLFDSLKYVGMFYNYNFSGYHVLFMNGLYLSLNTMEFLNPEHLENIDDLVVISSFYYEKSYSSLPVITFTLDISMHCEYRGVHHDPIVNIPNFSDEQLLTFPSGFVERYNDFKNEGIFTTSDYFSKKFYDYPLVQNFNFFKGFQYQRNYILKTFYYPQREQYTNVESFKTVGGMTLINLFNPNQFLLFLKVEEHADIKERGYRPVQLYPVHKSTAYEVYRIMFKDFNLPDDNLYPTLLNSSVPSQPPSKCCLAECFGITE